jgi:hypothetical protein
MQRAKRARDDTSELSQGEGFSFLANLGRSGVLTSKRRYEFPPSNSIKASFYVKIHRPEAAVPLFSHMPVWLRPLLYFQHEHGHSEEWLCSVYQDLPADLMTELKIVFSAVITLVLNRISNFDKSLEMRRNTSMTNSEFDACLYANKPWLYDCSRFSDEELETYNEADVAIMRYSKHFRILRNYISETKHALTHICKQVDIRAPHPHRHRALRQPSLLPPRRPPRRRAARSCRPQGLAAAPEPHRAPGSRAGGPARPGGPRQRRRRRPGVPLVAGALAPFTRSLFVPEHYPSIIAR